MTILPHLTKPRKIRYEKPIPFSLWIGYRELRAFRRRFGKWARLCGRNVGSSARLRSGALAWKPMAIKLLPPKPEPVRYANPTPFTLWVEWWPGELGHPQNQSRFRSAGREDGFYARRARPGGDRRTKPIAIKLLPPKPIRYENPIPFSLWVGARETSTEHPLDWTMLCGGEVGSFTRNRFWEDYEWRPIAVKLLPKGKRHW